MVETIETTCVERHVVLVAPEVHWNAGNIGRTCLGAGAALHLVQPLGFSLNDRHLKRAGLDYWPRVPLSVWEGFDRFLDRFRPKPDEIAFFSKLGRRPFWQMPNARRLFLVFGSESRGLPPAMLAAHSGQSYFIPILDAIRSLNLSTAAGIALYESLRLRPPVHGWPAAVIPE